MSYGGLLRRVRRLADLSQRELAERAGVAASVVSRIETGWTHPRIPTLERLLAAAGFRLQAVSRDGTVIETDHTWLEQDQPRDGAHRRFPAHLDVRTPHPRRPWWFWIRNNGPQVPPPLLTFDLSRGNRDFWRKQDGRTSVDPDERMRHPFGRSRVHIPGYRPASVYGGRAAAHSGFW